MFQLINILYKKIALFNQGIFKQCKFNLICFGTQLYKSLDWPNNICANIKFTFEIRNVSLHTYIQHSKHKDNIIVKKRICFS